MNIKMGEKDILNAYTIISPYLFCLLVFCLCAYNWRSRKKRTTAGDEVTFLVQDLEAILEMNRLLEDENKQLKQEVTRLKTQASALKAQDSERKSNLWKKFQHKATSQSKSDQPPAKTQRPTTTPPPRSGGSTQTKKTAGGLPPPPPPLPSGPLVVSRTVKRVPEVVEFYRQLTRKGAQTEKKASVAGKPGDTSSRNMIGEIEDRSTYLSAIKEDVTTQRDLINRLINEIENAAFTNISAVDEFVKWLDEELSCLIDERAVLKHFTNWPERKADALREAACSYRELISLEAEILGFEDDPRQSLGQRLGKMQTLQDRFERKIGNFERTRDSLSKRYRELQIPWEWMLDSGLIGKIKLSSLKLARMYMKMVAEEAQSPTCTKVDNLLLQGARLAYRVHQFAGGFDTNTKKVFEELKQVYDSKDIACGGLWGLQGTALYHFKIRTNNQKQAIQSLQEYMKICQQQDGRSHALGNQMAPDSFPR